MRGEGVRDEDVRDEGGATHSQELPNFIENISEHKHFLVSIEPAIFSDPSNQLERYGDSQWRQWYTHPHTCTSACVTNGARYSFPPRYCKT